MVGQTLGHYRIDEQIGAGGMGVVYRATDLNLKRQVAVKMLPEDCAKDPDRRARFEREARLLASLDHRNIGAIHGLELSEGKCFLVLELVPGETLNTRLTTDPPGVEEALRICRQIAEALEAAHDKGIIHRDLKPANVKVTPDGVVKVLDFGLAKALQMDSAGSGEPLSTVTMDRTAEGMILGTAAYMSPEQARGKPVDKRTDSWAFGCVLYELLAHRRAFHGQTVSDFIAAVLSQQPDWKALPDTTPRNVRTLLKRCLEKEPHQRLRDIGDARIELEEALGAPKEAEEGDRRPSRRALFGVGGLAAGAAAAALILMLLRPEPPAAPVTRFAITLGADEVVSPLGSSVRLSPDGMRLAWVSSQVSGRTQIYYRQLDQLDTKTLAGTVGGSAPFFSPDGRSLAFLHSGSRTLKRLAVSGGAAVTICPTEASATSGGAWGTDTGILLNAGYPGAIVRIPAEGGSLKPVSSLDAKKDERVHSRPIILPGGRAILFMIGGGGMDTYDDARIAVQSLETGERKIVIDGGMAPSYSPTGHIVYARGGKLLAVPFDLKRLAVTGLPVPLVDGVFMCVNTGAAHYSLSANGTLAYAPGVVLGGERQLVWVDRRGKAEPLPLPPRPYLHPRLSPDGKRLAVEIEGPVHDFWSYELERGVMTKVSLEGSSHWPVWTPDGSRLTYRLWLSGSFSMWWIPADRSSPPERLTDIGQMQSASSWSPDGRVVAFTQVNLDTGADVYVMAMDGDRKPRPFAQTKFAEGSPKFSPDGRWIAYASNESGRNEIYVQAYPGPGAKIQVSTEGGTDAVWKRNGGELYYRDGDKMMWVEVNTSGSFRASKPKLLWTGRYAHGMGSVCGPPGTTSSNYDVAPDGQRFLMVKHDEVAPAQINVVVNWTEELKRMVQTKRF